jgi:hypothetical protein
MKRYLILSAILFCALFIEADNFQKSYAGEGGKDLKRNPVLERKRTYYPKRQPATIKLIKDPILKIKKENLSTRERSKTMELPGPVKPLDLYQFGVPHFNPGPSLRHSESFKTVKESNQSNGFIRWKKDRFNFIKKIDCDPKKSLETNYLALNRGGNCQILRMTRGDLVMIDAGFTRHDYENVFSTLQSCSVGMGKKIRVEIITTHPDTDHVRGISEILRKKYDVEVLAPRPGPEMKEAALKGFKRLTDTLDANGYKKIEGEDGTHLTRYIDPEPQFFESGRPVEPLRVEPVDLSFLGNKDYIPPAHNDLVSLVVRCDGDEKIKIYSYTKASNPNDASLVTWMEHNGVRRLQMGDAGMPVIRRLLSQSNSDKKIMEIEKQKIHVGAGLENEMQDKCVSIEADILLWPHHQWCPESRRDQETLKEFIGKVNPKEIFITKPPNKTQSRERLEIFLDAIRKSLNRGLKIHFLEDDGSYKLITLEFEIKNPAFARKAA